jgi:hypothetical protein
MQCRAENPAFLSSCLITVNLVYFRPACELTNEPIRFKKGEFTHND